MAEKKRLNLAFSMDDPAHKDGWSYLCGVPYGQRTDEICRLIQKKQDWELLLSSIRAIIQEELREHSIQTRPNTTLPEPAGNDAINDEVLGFLLSLQEEGEDTT